MSNVLRIISSLYLAGSLVYATLHLLGFGWSPTHKIQSSPSLQESSNPANKLETISVNQLQQKYHSAQTVTWINADGKTTQKTKQ